MVENTVIFSSALHDDVLIVNMNAGESVTASGIILRRDDATSHGIRPRWARIFAVGPEQKDVQAGQWILIEHGRWSRKVPINTINGKMELQKVDFKGILVVQDEEPTLDDQYQISIYGD
jgi:co-chaperonin GroES (HSP10)